MKPIRKYRVRWVERHWVTAIVLATSIEEAISERSREDFDAIYDIESIDAFGPSDADSYEAELIEDED